MVKIHTGCPYCLIGSGTSIFFGKLGGNIDDCFWSQSSIWIKSRCLLVIQGNSPSKSQFLPNSGSCNSLLDLFSFSASWARKMKLSGHLVSWNLVWISLSNFWVKNVYISDVKFRFMFWRQLCFPCSFQMRTNYFTIYKLSNCSAFMVHHDMSELQHPLTNDILK